MYTVVVYCTVTKAQKLQYLSPVPIEEIPKSIPIG